MQIGVEAGFFLIPVSVLRFPVSVSVSGFDAIVFKVSRQPRLKTEFRNSPASKLSDCNKFLGFEPGRQGGVGEGKPFLRDLVLEGGWEGRYALFS